MSGMAPVPGTPGKDRTRQPSTSKGGGGVVMFILDSGVNNDSHDDNEEDGEEYDPARPDGRRSKTPHHKSYTPTEYSYYKSLSKDNRKRIVALENELQSTQEREVPMRFKILSSGMEPGLKDAVLRKLECGAHNAKMMAWVDGILRVPFGKTHDALTRKNETVAQFLSRSQGILDAHVFGMDHVKQQFMVTLAKWVTNPKSKGLVLGIQGPAGVGKTTLVKDGLSAALGVPCRFIPLGGANDAAYLDGHGYTYEGSTWGRIVDMIMSAGVMNPILCFDELDKVAENSRGAEIYNVLIHLTDASQNDSFTDKYFAGVKFDLSRCITVFTYNDASVIHPILRNRMIEVSVDDYTPKEKVTIMRDHMLPKIRAEYRELKIDIPEDVIKHLVSKTAHLGGMRDVKHDMQHILGVLNLRQLTAEKEHEVAASEKSEEASGSSCASSVLTKQLVDDILNERDRTKGERSSYKNLPDSVKLMYM